MEKEIAETEDIPIVVVTSTDIVSNIKDTTFIKVCGHQLYKNKCKEKLSHITLLINMVVGHMPLGENGKFLKIFFYFLCADPYWKCNITVTEKAVNLGDGDRMQVPCILHLSGQKSMVEILKQQKMT